MKLFQSPRLATAIAVARARLETSARRARLEEIAHRVGADLSDPEQFRIAQELAHQR